MGRTGALLALLGLLLTAGAAEAANPATPSVGAATPAAPQPAVDGLLPLVSTHRVPAKLTVEAQRLRRNNGTAVICISPQPGQVVCDPDKPSAPATGYQVELFIKAIETADLSLTLGAFEWRCLDWQPMIDDLTANDGSCYMSLGIDIFAEHTARGIKFTWPTLTQGLEILTTGTYENQGMWTVFSAFHWSIWIALLCTIVGVGLLLGVMHRCSSFVSEANWEAEASASRTKERDAEAAVSRDACGDAGKAGPRPDPSQRPAHAMVVMEPRLKLPRSRSHALRRLLRKQFGLRKGERLKFAGLMGDHVWQAAAVSTTISEGGVTPPRNLPGRILYVTFLFLVLVMIQMFTANTAGIVTTMRLSSTIMSRADLSGKAVGVWDGYAQLLKNTEIVAVQLPWENDEDLQKMTRKLRSGTIKALLIDAATAEFIAKFNSSCKLHVVGDNIQEWGAGFAFPKGTSDGLIARWNAALLSIQQGSNMMDVLKTKFLGAGGSDECTKRLTGDQYQLQFGQVAGLWMILVAAAVVACLLLVLLFLGRNYPSLRMLAFASLGPGAEGGVPQRSTSFKRLVTRALSSRSFGSARRSATVEAALESGDACAARDA